MQCLIRNLFIVVWPLEVLTSLINPHRRLGDFITGTMVIPSKKENVKSIFKDLRNLRTNQSAIFTIILSIILIVVIHMIIQDIIIEPKI